MLRNAAFVCAVASLFSCGKLESKIDAKLDAAGDVIGKASAKIPDVKQYEKDLEEKIRNLDVKFVMQTVRYDPSTKVFTNLTPPATERNLFSVEQIGGKLYVLGGLNPDGNYVSTLEAYDPTTDSWASLADWPHPGFAYVEKVGELLCAIGGYKNLTEPIRRNVDCYDPATDAWFAGPQIPESYSSFAPVVQDGKVYLLGGTSASLGLVSSAWSYDPLEGEWHKLKSLPEARGLMGAASVGGRIYLTGGFGTKTFDRDDADKLQDLSMLVYDPATDQWSHAPDMPHARALYGIDSVNGKLAVFFGITTGPLVELYDPSTSTWMNGEDPPTLPSGGIYTYVKHNEQMHLFVIADQISISKIGSSGALWRYDETTNTWGMIARRGSDERDALFVGDSVNGAIYWVGAETVITY
jgi:hypothetical protein